MSIQRPKENKPLDNDRITGIPNDMINNQFGMLGLLKLTDIDPSFGVFAPGIDLSRHNLHNLPPPGKSKNDINAADIATSSEPTSSTTVATTTNTTTASIPASYNEFKPKSIAESTAKCKSESSEAGDSTHSIELLDNDRITGIPNDMINNQFGMLGLLKLTDIDPSFGVFAPGIDLSRH
ncbi:unnamed protein product, partial [Taenia asiatica]|uniref:NOT2_3_5 domain-containing protein n=1 Tax=Taenia asiatica TaxID=60517 RepID=A0A0R3WFS9_TAEAS